MSEFPEELRDLKKKLADIEQTARENAAKNLSIAERAEQGRLILEHYESQVWPEAGNIQGIAGFTMPPTPSFGTLHLQRLTKAKEALRQGHHFTQAAQFDVGFVVTSVSTAVSGVIINVQVNKKTSPGQVKITYPAFDRSGVQKTIDQRLRGLEGGERLIEKRQGAWKTFALGGPESFGQACHSMREILTALLDDFCPEDKVKEAEWWQAAPDTRVGVSKRQKIRYFIIGPKVFRIQDEDRELEHQVDTALEVHTKAIAVAHGKIVDREVARTVLISLEDMLESLLGQRERVAWIRGHKAV
jgi:hypothetical protein